jgi:predicted MFS family arabinose efflux permease
MFMSDEKTKRGLGVKLGFDSGRAFGGFMSVVLVGQIIYSCFEALKSVFYTPLMHIFNLSNAQLGVIFSLTGISIFFSIPGSWVNNRFSVKSILITSMIIRMITIYIVLLCNPNYTVMKIVAATWGIVDGVFWPAVLNGVNLFTNKKNKGVAFGLLESVRRLLEMVMNMLLIGVMSAAGTGMLLHCSQMQIFRTGLLIYNLLLIPLIIAVAKLVPTNGIAADKHNKSKGKDALAGVWQVIKMPKLWIAAITAFCIFWSYTFSVYTTPFLQDVFHLGQTQASLFGTISTAGIGIIASFLSGFISDRLLKSTGKMIFMSMSMAFLAILIVLLLPKNSATLVLTMIFILIFACGMFMAKGIMEVPASQIPMPEKYRGAAMSVTFFVAYSPKIFAYSINGKIIDQLGPNRAFNIIFTTEVIIAGIGVLLSLFLIRMEKKEKAQKLAEEAEKQNK